jgi:hypothetical protein
LVQRQIESSRVPRHKGIMEARVLEPLELADHAFAAIVGWLEALGDLEARHLWNPDLITALIVEGESQIGQGLECARSFFQAQLQLVRKGGQRQVVQA